MRKLSLIGHYKLDATPKMLHWSILDIGGVFGRVDFREDEKQKKKRGENFLESVWLEEGERKILVGTKCFLLRFTKKFSLKWGEN